MTQPCPTRRCVDLNQGVQFPIAKAYADMRAAELMVYHAAARYETGANVGAEANMAKMLAADASWAAADMCVQTFGGFGFAEEYDRSEEHTSELQSLMRISYAVFCLKKKKTN